MSNKSPLMESMENKKDSVRLTKEFREKVKPLCGWLKENFDEQTIQVIVGKKFSQLHSPKLGILVKIENNEES